jgi:hypothetical protein
MHLDALGSVVPHKSAAVRRITAEGIHWRVLVESWRERGEYVGRLLFEPDTAEPLYTARTGSPMLRGSTSQEVVMSAHDLSENRLKEVLHSLR